MDAMEQKLSKERDTLIGQFNFYYNRSDARSVARAPFAEVDGDLGRACT